MNSISLFLGPNGENKDILIEQINNCLNTYIKSRQYYNNKQPNIFNDKFKNEIEYEKTKQFIHDNVVKLNEYLKDSIHFESLTYQSQMNADLLVPGLIGHVSGLLYNQNNVAHQGSPKTTPIEHALIIDLIKMVGFELPNDFITNYYNKDNDDINNISIAKDLIIPAGHLTSGGSLSNFEGCWCSLWVKFIPLAIKNSILKNELLNCNHLNIIQNGHSKRLLDMTTWELININSDQAVSLPFTIALTCNIPLNQVYKILKSNHPSTLGIYEFLNSNKITPPVIIIPITAHYSFQKSATSLGLGIKNLISIPVDNKGRIIISKLYEQLLICIKNEIPVVTTVLLLGSTQEGSVDDIEQVVSIRNHLRIDYNFNFDIHIDAAFGGYYLSLIKPEYPIESPLDHPNLFNSIINPAIINSNPSDHDDDDEYYLNLFEPELILSDYIKRQLNHCKYADTITIDSHKTGYTPYQCGSILYRNSKFKNILSISRNYIGHNSLSMGLESIEGSRGGQSVTSSYLNHCICRPNKIGYGNILKRCLLISKLYIIQLLFLSTPNDSFNVYQIGFEPTQNQIEYFKTECINQHNGSFKSIKEICKNESLLENLSSIGLNLSVVCFNFNFKLSSSSSSTSTLYNKDYIQFVKFNESIMKRFNYNNGPHNDLILSGTYFDSNYNYDFLNSIITSIGLTDNLPSSTHNLKIPVLRASIMNPHLYKYLNQTMNIIKQNINTISSSFII